MCQAERHLNRANGSDYEAPCLDLLHLYQTDLYPSIFFNYRDDTRVDLHGINSFDFNVINK